jgi:predicted amidophosphoribosyltransferase
MPEKVRTHVRVIGGPARPCPACRAEFRWEERLQAGRHDLCPACGEHVVVCHDFWRGDWTWDRRATLRG